MSKPLSEADIIFPHLFNTPNFSSTLASIRRSTLSVHNRLHSILSDSIFVASVSTAYSLPLVANERCGSWYIPPDRKRGSVYFKSTDGHMSQWRFSLRRLNLQLLDVVRQSGGAVIVDSTRRGKSMPDALSKTVPIWCCVVNRVVFGREGKAGRLRTPPGVVGESENAQIEERIDAFAKSFLDVCKPDIENLRTKLQKPLRPIWVTQGSSLPESVPSFPNFHPIILCTASRRVHGAETSENGYIQGAADDHEAWANGLTPSLFWKHKDQLLATSEDEAPAFIERLALERQTDASAITLVKPTTNLHVASSENINLESFDIVISCTPEPLSKAILKPANIKHYIHLKCATGKLGSRDLRTQLPSRLPHLNTLLTSNPHSEILICCPTGKDLSVGTALAILCLYTSDSGIISNGDTKPNSSVLSKDFIKQRLSWITLSNPALNPSRATLQSINSILLSGHCDPKTMSPPAPAAPSSSSSQHLTPGLTKSLPIRTKPSINNLVSESQRLSLNDDQENQNKPPPSASPKGLPAIVFQKWEQHKWTFTRTLTSALPSHPSGNVTGTATFTPCPGHPNTLLYAEQGEFTTHAGSKFNASRKYVYRLVTTPAEQSDEENRDAAAKRQSEKLDKEQYIKVHFFNDDALPRAASPADGVGEKGEGIGGLFVEMGSLVLADGGKEWKAENKESHLCVEDLYAAKWRFGLGMLGEGKERWWEVKYDVEGPKKGYISTTRYAVSEE